MPPVRRYGEWMAIFSQERRAVLYTDEFLHSLPDCDPLEFLEDAFDRWAGRDLVTRIMLTDLETYLPCDLMTKVDIASMAWGLECRQPFLDHELVSEAVAMPITVKRRGWQTKWVLKQAFGDLLPAEVFYRRKMGFGVPLSRWFRSELRDLAYDVLLDSRTVGRGFFRAEAVKELLTEHMRGTFDHAYRLWALLVFELWLRAWERPAPVGGQAPRRLCPSV
jgi:asparagine synthase (glutamine-hydrolysing)